MTDPTPQITPSPMVDRVIASIYDTKRRNITRGINAARDRRADFANSLEATLTGIALEPSSREHADAVLDEEWNKDRAATLSEISTRGGRTDREVIVGSGFHAAVYAATRVRAGYPRPLVIESEPRPGGTFAMTDTPVFYLNSRNNPGGPGLAGDQDVDINYLPGAVMQASNVSASKYPTNADMAFVIRMALAQFADVIPQARVLQYSNTEDFVKVATIAGGPQLTYLINAARVIDARGLGKPRNEAIANGTTILTFPQFMRRMAGLWPLRGVRRVAVVGGGDSARSVVESLLGLSPGPFMGSARLDWVQRVDWYGPDLPETCEAWRDKERSRYQGIGAFLRPDGLGRRRLKVFPRRAFPVALPGAAVIGGRFYDMVVMATGNTVDPVPGLDEGGLFFSDADGGAVARRAGRTFRVGPAANLPLSETEVNDGLGAIPNNKVSMFRMGGKTAVLAATLGQPSQVGTLPAAPSGAATFPKYTVVPPSQSGPIAF